MSEWNGWAAAATEWATEWAEEEETWAEESEAWAAERRLGEAWAEERRDEGPRKVPDWQGLKRWENFLENSLVEKKKALRL
jgi:hypothetical protein